MGGVAPLRRGSELGRLARTPSGTAVGPPAESRRLARDRRGQAGRVPAACRPCDRRGPFGPLCGALAQALWVEDPRRRRVLSAPAPLLPAGVAGLSLRHLRGAFG